MFFSNIETFFGSVALITSFIGLTPQVYKAYLTKSTHDISLLMLLNYISCSIAWIIYGYYHNLNIVILSNTVGFIVSFISIVQKYYYDARP